ncbi:hypothetical protein AA313_de0200128 [Arthrobotrys entomopaga]|nr:hypothetical protein AA313_de0200128 [Arthrobotrys entomopaga]
MEDDDLQKIRQARLQQLQQEQGASGGGGGGQAGQQDAQREAEAEARKSMLTQILTPEANDRLGRIALVKADRARDLENRLIMMARAGQIRQRITDNDLKSMLEGANDGKKEENKVVFQRRRGVLDDDEDDWDL